MSQHGNYPYELRIEYENGIPRVELSETGMDTYVFQRTNGNTPDQLEIEYQIHQGRCVSASNEVTVDDARNSDLSHRRLAVVGPVWQIAMQQVSESQRRLTIGYTDDLEQDFDVVNSRSVFTAKKASFLSDVYPWLNEHKPTSGHLWVAAYGDSREADEHPMVRALLYRQDPDANNPFVPPAELRELDQTSRGLHTQKAVETFLDTARAVVQG